MAVAPDRPADASVGRNEGAAAQKILHVLEAVAAPGGPHKLADITAKAGVSKSTAHRVIVLLTAENYIVAVGGGRYGVGPHLRVFAAQVLGEANDGVQSLLRDLQQAVGGHTVHLALRSGDHAVYLHKIDGTQPYQMASRVGMHIPLHCTAIGKAILSMLDPAEVDETIGRVGLPRRTPTTITDAHALHLELATIRARGVAVDNEENEATIRCIAVPVAGATGHVLGGISVSTVTFAVDADELAGFAGPLRIAAGALAPILR